MDLKGLKINVIGDSISEGVGASCRENGYCDVLTRKTGAVVRNYGVSGSRIANQCIERPWFIPHLDSYVVRSETMDRDADVILVFGGSNDFGHGDAPFGDDQIFQRVLDAYTNAFEEGLIKIRQDGDDDDRRRRERNAFDNFWKQAMEKYLAEE